VITQGIVTGSSPVLKSKNKSMLYRLTTSRGMYDDYHQIDIGTYSSNALALGAKEEFLLEVQKILDANPCPIDNEMIKKIENYNMGEYEEDEQQRIEDLYMNWKYGAVYAVTELNLTDTRITEVELDSTNFDFLIRDF
jgi:hypothetical protein